MKIERYNYVYFEKKKRERYFFILVGVLLKNRF